MTDTPLDLDAILAAHASASPYGRTEVAGRFHASYYADDADVALVFASIHAASGSLEAAQLVQFASLAACARCARRSAARARASGLLLNTSLPVPWHLKQSDPRVLGPPYRPDPPQRGHFST